ncbi:MAG: hypothetical protein ACREKK_13310, partial [Candidatus Methylomirabilales bacterium]
MKLRHLAAVLCLRAGFAFAQGDPPPDHLNLGGLCGLSSEIIGAPDRLVRLIIPAGDVDGDGKGDLLFLNHSRERGALPENLVVLLYG